MSAGVLALVAAGLAVAQGGAWLDRHDLDAGSLQQWRLPERLNEISGLALDDRGRLFAVADEEAVVYELDIGQGRLVKAFAYGTPPRRGDFEGIAIQGDRFWLITSDGLLLGGAEGGDGDMLDYDRVDTGFGKHCEIEGLAAVPGAERLLVVCKTLADGDRRRIDILAWSTASGAPEPAADISADVSDALRSVNANRLNPSGLVVVPGGESLLVVAARQRALVELAPDGSVVAARRLPVATRHRQPEGIEVTADGRLLLADEGGSHKARLSVYRQRGEARGQR